MYVKFHKMEIFVVFWVENLVEFSRISLEEDFGPKNSIQKRFKNCNSDQKVFENIAPRRKIGFKWRLLVISVLICLRTSSTMTVIHPF